jgi:uncharacterized protein (DUF488 family)
MTEGPELLTFGHGTASAAELIALVEGAGIAEVLDVRRFPGSRAHPHVGREALAESLAGAGVDYRWEERLGGRRRVPEDSPDVWWQVAGFRGYAAHMRTPEWRAAAEDLARTGAIRRTAVMCSESVWWRCHRRLIADSFVLLRGWSVRHLGHDGRLSPHRPSAGARVTADGTLVYDVAADVPAPADPTPEDPTS